MPQNPTLLNGAGTPLPQGPTPDGVPSAPAGPPDFTSKMLSQAQGRFDAVKKAAAQVARTRKGLDALVGMGDSVTSDDVLDEMADLVAHGADPKVLAALIAGNTQAGVGPMPPSGEPLAGWLQHAEAQIVAPMEAQLRPALALAQHQLGVAAMHRMVDLHAKAGGASPPQGATPLQTAPPPPGAGGFAQPPASPLLQ